MKNVFYACLVLLALSCSSDSSADQTAMDLVTGVTFRQNFEDLPLTLGNPNVRVNDQFVLYPNPAHQVILLQAQAPISAVWIVPAQAEKIYQSVDFSAVLSATTYSEATLTSHATLSLSEQSNNTVTMNIASLSEGYYRVFVKIGGELYWDNLYVNPIVTEEHIAEIIGFWD